MKPPHLSRMFLQGTQCMGYIILPNRLVYWETGWGIFKDYWLTGTGPWTYELLFPVYLGKETPGLVEWLLDIMGRLGWSC